MATWVDFRDLRDRLDFAQVLRFYGVELRVRGNQQHQGLCPLPNHQGGKRSRSFSASLPRKLFHCFSCGAKGNVLDFAALMQGLDPQNPAQLRQAALALARQFAPDALEAGGRTDKPKVLAQSVQPSTPAPEKPSEAQENAGQAATRPALVNVPLDFELKGLDADHPYLKGRGLTSETIVYFGLGYCSRGLMQGRIAIPLHDRRGRLVGYAGRLADEGQVDADRPKYLFPGPRLRGGRSLEFRKSLFLYHGFQIPGLVSDLVVVEGFPSVWWLWQAGVASVVGLMGSDCSCRQLALILKATRPGGRVWLLPDGDGAGRRCAEALLPKLAAHRFTHWVRLGEGQQPTDLAATDLVDLFGGRKVAKGGCHD